MRASICLSTFNKPQALAKVLHSIHVQEPSFSFEVIVVDDGSEDANAIRQVCAPYAWTKLLRIDREPIYRNPSVARNVAYRAAQGEVLICQSDDVVHTKPKTIQWLVDLLKPKRFVIATVINVREDGKPYQNNHGRGYGDAMTTYTSPWFPRPLFFLGSLYRKDMYAVGGCDEEFVDPSGEDRWLAYCLIHGTPKLRPIYTREIIGHHLDHEHTKDYAAINRSQQLLTTKLHTVQSESSYMASGGPWAYQLRPAPPNPDGMARLHPCSLPGGPVQPGGVGP